MMEDSNSAHGDAPRLSLSRVRNLRGKRMTLPVLILGLVIGAMTLSQFRLISSADEEDDAFRYQRTIDSQQHEDIKNDTLLPGPSHMNIEDQDHSSNDNEFDEGDHDHEDHSTPGHTRTRKYALVPSCNSPCLLSMGKYGFWKQDWDFAKEYGQFPLPLVIKPGPHAHRTGLKFQPSEDAPFPWWTSWKWVNHKSDKNMNMNMNMNKTEEEERTCQIRPMTHEVVCRVLVQLGVDRIAFYGDSLTEGQYKSFMNMMGPEHTRNIESMATDGKVQDSLGLVCPDDKTDDDDNDRNASESSNMKNVTIPIFYRRPIGERAGHLKESVYEIAEDLLSFIHKAEDKRFLGIFNIGAHYGDHNIYSSDIHRMLDAISSLNRTQDLHFFRTTVPGHVNCNPRNSRAFNWTRGTRDVPFASIDQLQLNTSLALRHGWHNFQHFNQYTKDVIEKYHKAGDIPMIHILDVYNMTALRHDGHTGVADCLHYFWPGPMDWWNHLLFTYLEKVRIALQETDSMNCRPW